MPQHPRALYVIITVLIGLFQPVPGRADELVVDLSKHLVAISTAFTGADVLLFGAVKGPGDIIVTVRGPDEDEEIYRKSRRMGIWVNGEKARFKNIPAYYATASNRPIAQFAGQDLLERHQIGVRNLHKHHKQSAAFTDALIRTKATQALYQPEPANVTFLGDQLFRTDLTFPANIPTGTYLVSIYLVRDNHVVSTEVTPLIVNKTGASAELFFFAHDYSALYGIAAIVIAAVAGWLASIMFRKG